MKPRQPPRFTRQVLIPTDSQRHGGLADESLYRQPLITMRGFLLPRTG